jgi:nicotinate phosphoribosyltransferase
VRPYPVFGFVSPDNMAMLTDLYELTMADSYLRQRMNERATFSLFIRDLPRNRAFLVSAGLEPMLHYLEGMRFDNDALEYLRSLRRFSTGFLDYLKDFRFSGTVRAIPEGEVFFPQEPLLEVSAPRIEAQIVETFVLNTVNFAVTIASKAARLVLAAQGRGVIDFSPRQDHGADAAVKVARASYLAGCIGSSCVLAGQLYGIPVFGTMAHSYVMSFDDELAAFRAFAQDFPNNCVLLIDTYDTLKGTEHAIIVGHELAKRGHRLAGVRIDSYRSIDDLVETTQKVRRMLNEAGFSDARIVLSHELTEHKIAEVLRKGAPANSFGVGTELGTSPDAPFGGATYKLVEDVHGYRFKLSTGKATLPGEKQVWRMFDKTGMMAGDTISLLEEDGPPGATPLLEEVMRDGRALRPESLEAMRERCKQRLESLPLALRQIVGSAPYPVVLSPQLAALRDRMYEQAGQEARR